MLEWPGSVRPPMFTGIIEALTPVRSIHIQQGAIRATFDSPRGWKLTLGQSIAIDGVCSTVTATGKNSFSVEYMPETLKKTTAGTFVVGTMVHLERSLTLNAFVDGHLVQGHVDTRATVTAVANDGAAKLITITLPKPLMRYVAPTGSIAIQGVSLTVARVQGNAVTVGIIPHTLAHTTLGTLVVGDQVNVETDLVARYIARATVPAHAARRKPNP